MQATIEIKYALVHSSFIWRAAVVFSVLNLQPSYFFCALKLRVCLPFCFKVQRSPWAIATIEAPKRAETDVLLKCFEVKRVARI